MAEWTEERPPEDFHRILAPGYVEASSLGRQQVLEWIGSLIRPAHVLGLVDRQCEVSSVDGRSGRALTIRLDLDGHTILGSAHGTDSTGSFFLEARPLSIRHGLKGAIYNMFSWVRDQPDRDLDGLMEEIDHLFLHSEEIYERAEPS